MSDGTEVEEGETTDLTPQEELFCEAYANPESKTYGNATGSARAAKYAQPHNAAWKLRRRPRIIARLVELHEMAAAGLGKVMADIEHTRLAALKKGDLATAARCSELQGKRLGAFVDVSVVDDVARREYSEVERIEAMRLGNLLLEDAEEEEDREQKRLNEGALPAPAPLADATPTPAEEPGQASSGGGKQPPG